MPFCRRCGEVCHSEKCSKCGNVVQASQNTTCSTSSSSSSMDQWQKSYMESVIGLDALLLSHAEKKALRSSSSSSTVSSSSSILHNQTRRPVLPLFFESKKKIAPSPSTGLLNQTKKGSMDKGHCSGCSHPLGGKTVRLPNSQTRYHWGCLTCAQCREPFRDTSFHADASGKIYHPKCYSLSLVDTTTPCGRCSSGIRGAYLVIRHTPIHPQCFRCTSCKKVLSPSSLYIDTPASAYCQPCGKDLTAVAASTQTKIVPQLQLPPPLAMMPPSLSSQKIATSATSNDAASDQVKPSSLMCRRVTPLPRFGMRKVCAGCNETIVSIHEEKPGPRATRWHPKCLCCQGCAKVLDSAAVVHENATTGGLDPWCRLCLLVKSKQQRPQRSSTMPTMSAQATLQ